MQRTSVFTTPNKPGRRPPRAAAGFTMIEILVVLVVVGLLAAMVVVNLGGGTQQRELASKVRELFVLMQTASEQAVLNNQELGLVINEDGYRFLVFDELESEWGSPGERLFRPRRFDPGTAVTPFIEDDMPRLTQGDSDDEDSLRPDIVFFSSGETTEFELELLTAGSPDRIYRIASDGYRGLEMTLPGEDGA